MEVRDWNYLYAAEFCKVSNLVMLVWEVDGNQIKAAYKK